ncbi:Uncharacterised protein [Mobiluncus curtisii subsp. curtisii]|nr:Uncharacterised protein [Mobiluncus curtisii subsp. curtisii]
MLIENSAGGMAKCFHHYARSPAKSSGEWNRRRLLISPASAGKGAFPMNVKAHPCIAGITSIVGKNLNAPQPERLDDC